MALIKCPECTHMVSEHADFCSQCGCKMGYITSYYKKIKSSEKLKKKKTPILDTLTDLQKQFIYDLEAALSKDKLPFYLDVRTDFVGFRKEKNEKLLIYMNRRVDGKLYIHVFNQEKGENETSLFEDGKISSYIETARRTLFSPLLTKTSTDEQVDVFALKTKEELEAVCKYTVLKDVVIPIQIDDVTLENGTYRVWFTMPDGKRRFCSLNNIDNILFDTEVAAKTHIQRTRKTGITMETLETKKETYKYFLVSNGQYFIGFREALQTPYVWTKVPNFSFDKKKAVVFLSEETATNLAKDISEVTGHDVKVEWEKGEKCYVY